MIFDLAILLDRAGMPTAAAAWLYACGWLAGLVTASQQRRQR